MCHHVGVSSLPKWLQRRRRFGRRGPEVSRQALIDRKHRLEGEIRQLNGRISAGAARGENIRALQARVDRLRSEHLETRLRIDRTR